MSNATPLIHDNFLLGTDAARELYHRYAADLPIIDYHCHLSPSEIAQNKRWDNITQIWLYGDHYKWRAMRTAGIGEKFCTGDATDWEKFEKYAELMPKALRNPLYHWTHLELARYFGISDTLLKPATARDIYDRSNAVITQPGFSCRSLMLQSKVEVVCTTDDPADTLEHHIAIAKDSSFPVQVRPTWRPDKALAVDKPPVLRAWLEQLAKVSGKTEISRLGDLLEALHARHDFFEANGCRLSDRGLETIYSDPAATEEDAAKVFVKALEGQRLSQEEIVAYKSFMLHELAVMDAKKGWTQQLHYGALRSNNTAMLEKIGPDTGFDSIGDWPVAEAMSRYFDRLEQTGRLPKTIIYNLNPRDNELIATMIGNFQDGITAGKMQFGSGWWFLDQLDGMTRQIEALSQLGLLSQFVGMLTDSRSFLSYTRHEYFRRLLCDILGNDIERGYIPRDFDLVGGMVQDISYYNARRYFGFYNL
ncbi:MAG: glucuronate isomerase [Candidatus Methylacidiphilales bacterium]|nr:glucuronate isomerase [Candidatus Methylacidiphilales bacterium]